MLGRLVSSRYLTYIIMFYRGSTILRIKHNLNFYHTLFLRPMNSISQICYFIIQNSIVCDNGTGFVKVNFIITCIFFKLWRRKFQWYLKYLSCTFKVGYAGQNFPSSIFPSIVGRPILRAEEVRIFLKWITYHLLKGY